MSALRKGLPPLPARMEQLPVDVRGYPIPWFVITMPDGTRDFRIADEHKRQLAARDRRCWICGDVIGRPRTAQRWLTFAIGPMCVVNSNTSEPGCHHECATFAAIACPFMTLPKAQYRRAELPDDATSHYGGLPGNPGCVALYVTDTFKPYKVPGGWLIRLGEPKHVEWYSEGRIATRERVLECMRDRLPALQDMAREEGLAAETALAQMVQVAEQYLPAEAMP